MTLPLPLSPAPAGTLVSGSPEAHHPRVAAVPSSDVQQRAGVSAGRGETLRLTIPGPPVGKGRPRMTRRGHAFTPEKTRSGEDIVKRLARGAGFQPLAGRLAVRVHFYCDTVRGDVDNFVKLVTDALNGIAYEDDSQIDVITARREFDWERPRTELEIESISADVPKKPRKKSARGGR